MNETPAPAVQPRICGRTNARVQSNTCNVRLKAAAYKCAAAAKIFRR
jgi:hypothetical protein